MLVALQMMAVVALIHGIYFAIKRDVAKLGHFAGKFSVVMMIVVGAVYGLFISGETFAEPGEGNNALALTLLWVLPLVVMVVLAWKLPKIAEPLLYIFFLLAIVANLGTLAYPAKYSEFFHTEGPWLGIGSFVFTIAVTVWGYQSKRVRAGLMSITVALLPILEVVRMGEPQAILGAGSSAALLTPGFIAGVLLIMSDRLDHEVVG